MTIGRRKLLVIGIGAGAAIACGPDTGVTLPKTIDAGNESDLPVGTLRAIPDKSVAIGRDSSGIYAMSLICTHAGCDMSIDGAVSAGSVQCFCHGSVFDSQGNVIRGPARDPLQHLVVTKDASGALTIHGDEAADATARLPA